MTIHVGLVGYGMSGSVFHAPLIEYTPGLTLKTVVSSDPAKVQMSLACGFSRFQPRCSSYRQRYCVDCDCNA